MTPPSLRPVTLAVFIDALGWALLARHDWLRDLLPHQSPLGTVFGYSSACDPTILTGVMPRDHGHFAFYTYAPDRSPFTRLAPLRWLPDGLAGRGRVRHLISRVLAPMLDMRGYFQLYNAPFDKLHLFDYTERRDLYAPGGINGGQPTIIDVLRARGLALHISDWRASERTNIDALAAALRAGTPDFAYLFLGSLDAVLHEHGTHAPQVDERLDWYARELRGLVALARARSTDVRLLVFSDHGMADVVEECDVIARIDALGLRFGVDYAAVYDSTMARFWFLTAGTRERILAALGNEPRGRVLTDDELRAWGCDFPGRTFGEAFFLLDSGVLLNPSFMGRTRLAGMHGYDPTHPDSTAAFATNIAGLRPARLDALFDAMQACALAQESGLGARKASDTRTASTERVA